MIIARLQSAKHFTRTSTGLYHNTAVLFALSSLIYTGWGVGQTEREDRTC